MTSPDGGGVMPREVMRFECKSKDGVHAKFPTEEKTGRRVLVSMRLGDQGHIQ